MLRDKKIVVVMPAYNAEATLKRTVDEIDRTLVDQIILVDDCSRDDTLRVAEALGLQVYRHQRNLGYGGNQKTCYRQALALGADYVVMLHPDYQYTPKLIPAMVSLLASGLYEVVLASRILGGQALAGGMPFYKYLFNRVLTLAENVVTGLKLSEYHTGYRAYTREVLETIALKHNSDDFVFDNQLILQAHYAKFRIAEITCPTRYFADASSINFRRSLRYGLGCLGYSLVYWAAVRGFIKPAIFGGGRRERGVS